jgi:rhamnosyltransferase
MCLNALETYWNQVEKLYVIDNSEIPDFELVSILKSYNYIQYIDNGNNLGVAYALNLAARLAIADGYHYLLTMDDDSKAPSDMVSRMLTFLNNYTKKADVGIVSAIHNINKVKANSFQQVLFTMTSGNLLNLDIYQKVGRFQDDLFIDHIDHEYGLRLNKLRYQVIELTDVLLEHELGEQKKTPFINSSFISHNPIRGYYFVRNGISIACKYPNFRITVMKLFSKEIIKILLLENNRLQRLRLITLGIRDAFLKKMGKLNYSE